MTTKSKTTYWLNLGDIGEEVEADVVFNWYKARIKAEDDYDELEIESVIVVLDGTKLDVVDILGKTALELLTEHCWDQVGD